MPGSNVCPECGTRVIVHHGRCKECYVLLGISEPRTPRTPRTPTRKPARPERRPTSTEYLADVPLGRNLPKAFAPETAEAGRIGLRDGLVGPHDVRGSKRARKHRPIADPTGDIAIRRIFREWLTAEKEWHRREARRLAQARRNARRRAERAERDALELVK